MTASRTLRTAVLAAAALALVGSAGCTRVPIDRTQPAAESETHSADLGSATDARVELRMGVGRLNVSTGDVAPRVYEGDFTFSPASWRPEFTETTEGETLVATVAQPDAREFTGGEPKNEWNISLAEDVPMELDVALGVGESTLELGGSKLGRLQATLGAGDVTVDLRGDWTDDLDAEIEAGVGRLELIVPEDVGVRVRGQGEGIGEFTFDGLTRDGDAYVNDAYASSDVKLEIVVSAGIGDIKVTTAP